MNEKIEGKRELGRRHISWLQNIRKQTRLDAAETFRLAEDRDHIAILIANFHFGKIGDDTVIKR